MLGSVLLTVDNGPDASESTRSPIYYLLGWDMGINHRYPNDEQVI